MDKKLLTVLTSLLLFCALLLSGCQSLGIYPKGPHFERTGDMHYARSGHTATLLKDGTVLIAGGGCDTIYGSFEKTRVCTPLPAEIYDPKKGSFTVVKDRMKEAHFLWGSVAPILSDGRVVFIGAPGEHAEIYDPKTRTFSLSSGKTSIPRNEHALTVLKDDQVLIIGGLGKDRFGGYSILLNNAEIYDSRTQEFTSISAMNSPHRCINTVILPNGKILIVGSDSILPESINNPLEEYNSTLQNFNQLPVSKLVRSNGQALMLRNKKVLLIGGSSYMFKNIPAEIYNPLTGEINIKKYIGPLHAAAATSLLPNGKILITGGTSGAMGSSGFLETAELYNPDTDKYTQLPNMMEKRVNETSTLLPNGKVLITGGALFTNPSKTAELFIQN